MLQAIWGTDFYDASFFRPKACKFKRRHHFSLAFSFHTRWARKLFPQEPIQAKIEEVEQLLRLLETAPAAAAGD
jgi:hypothetical protein